MSAAETQMDLDRITHPLRLAQASHRPGTGKGCVMNAISYINGDTRITDFPDRLSLSPGHLGPVVQRPAGRTRRLPFTGKQPARPRTRLADRGNRRRRRHRCARLAGRTAGQPHLGVVKYAKITAVKSILDIAELHRNAASGDMPSIAAWDAADCAAARAIEPHVKTGAAHSRSGPAYESTAVVNAQR